MKQDFFKEYSIMDPHELFQTTMNAKARGDMVLLSRLKSSHSAKSSQYVVRVRVSLDFAYAMLVLLGKIEATITTYDEIVLLFMNHNCNLNDANTVEDSAALGPSAEADTGRDSFLDDRSSEFDDKVAQEYGPSWLAFDKVCRSEMGLSPEVVLQAWMPNAASYLEKIEPIFGCLDPEGDIDRELESDLRNFWQTSTS